jgi:hypothetical protein
MFGTADLLNRTILGLFGLVLVSLYSCQSSSTSGGDCFYNYIDTHAKVIEMKPGKEGSILVVLDFDASKLALENQELGELKNITIDHNYLVRNNIEIGNKYSVTVSEITEGTCTPVFVSFNHSFE